jgi:hypothetical protein
MRFESKESCDEIPSEHSGNNPEDCAQDVSENIL